ncbi:transcriptional regulator, LacI family [Sphingomonas rubra]|uniref:Transcriptional regulator, LacI family n=1 Tax=Sphingomonas rubra TaxID=634430 RepID=A0A1I5UQ97_9SPHN|nr:transcriptional regulator, LacI family [Sphingomonas rubra]
MSLQTVSRILNKAPNVRDETVARVQAAIDRLGYVPSLAAQRMAGAHSYFILALNDRARTIADWQSDQGTGWVDQMLLGGMLTCAKHGYRMIVELVDTHSDHIERELMAALAAVQPDGVILTPPHSGNPLIVRLLTEQGISFARIGSTSAGGGFMLVMDDERAGRIATEHLVALGHRRIGFVAGPASYELSGWRVEGWRGAMAAAELDTTDLLVPGDFSHDAGRAAGAWLLELADPATAIIASNDQMALGVLELARGRGVRVPEALSLVSFDDTPAVRFAHPPLTAITQPVAQVAARAVELIIAARKGRASTSDPINIPVSLQIRQTTAVPTRSRVSQAHAF